MYRILNEKLDQVKISFSSHLKISNFVINEFPLDLSHQKSLIHIVNDTGYLEQARFNIYNPNLVTREPIFYNTTITSKLVPDVYSKHSCCQDTFSISHYTNMYLNAFSTLSNSTHRFVLHPSIDSADYAIFKGSFDSVISITHLYSNIYAHWMTDTMPALQAFPRHLISDSYFIINAMPSAWRDFLVFMGVSKNRIISLLHDQFVFARNVYVNDPIIYYTAPCDLVVKLRRNLVKLFKLDTVEPSNFVIHVRTTNVRQFINAEQVLKAAKERWPDLPWILTKDIFKMKEASTFFNKAKLVFYIHGSNCANVIFQQPNSSMIEVFGEHIDVSFIRYTRVLNIYHIVAQYDKIEHMQPNFDVDLPIEMCMDLIRLAMERMNPSSTSIT